MMRPLTTSRKYQKRLDHSLMTDQAKHIEKNFPVVPSLISTSQLSPRRESGDQYLFRSGTSNDPALLEQVENAIRRLMMPELETLKQEQKVQQSRQKIDWGRSYDSPSERRSERDIAEETVIRGEQASSHEGSKMHR